VELRGSRWTAHNEGEVAIEQGERVRVLRVDGVVVCVQPDTD
jgi:membrane protein implicated in regulation of membrane protease activity